MISRQIVCKFESLNPPIGHIGAADGARFGGACFGAVDASDASLLMGCPALLAFDDWFWAAGCCVDWVCWHGVSWGDWFKTTSFLFLILLVAPPGLETRGVPFVVALAVPDGPPVGFSWCAVTEVGGDFVGEFAYVGGFELGGYGASSVACGGDVVAVVEEGDSCV